MGININKAARLGGAAAAFWLVSLPSDSGPILSFPHLTPEAGLTARANEQPAEVTLSEIADRSLNLQLLQDAYIPSVVRLPAAAVSIITRSKAECTKPLDQTGTTLEEALQLQQLRKNDFTSALKYAGLLAELDSEDWVICADTLPDHMTNPKEKFSVLTRIFDAQRVIAISPQLMAGETAEDRVLSALHALAMQRLILNDHTVQEPPVSTYTQPLVMVQYMEEKKATPYKVVVSDRLMFRGNVQAGDNPAVTRTYRPTVPPAPIYRRIKS